MELIGILLLVLFLVLWLKYLAMWKYLKNKYPVIYSWLFSGPFIQRFYTFYNYNRAFDLVFQRKAEFSEDHREEPELLEEYQRLIKDKWYILEKWINYLFLLAAALGFMYGIYLSAIS